MDALTLVKKLLTARRYEEALTLAQGQARLHGGSSPWPLVAAFSLLSLNRFDEALRFAAEAQPAQGSSFLPAGEFWPLLGRRAFLEQQYEVATQALARALQHTEGRAVPDEDELRLLLGCSFEACGNYAAALDELEKLGDADASLLLQRAFLLLRLQRPDEALALGQRAMSISPEEERVALHYGALLEACGRPKDARRCWRAFLHARGDEGGLIAARLAFTLPSVLRDAAQAEEVRRAIGRIVRDGSSTPLGRPEHVLPMPPFYLAFHGRDDKNLLAGMARFLARRTELYRLLPDDRPLRERAAALRPPSERRIGFLSCHFGHHTLMSYFFNLLKGVAPRLGQCVFLEFPQEDNVFRRELAAAASMRTLPAADPSRLAAVRNFVVGLDLDVLVYLDLGMDVLPWLLAFTRPAKVQCVLYGHPMTTGIRQVDFFLSPAALEAQGAARFYAERLRVLPGLLSGFLPPPGTLAARPASGGRPRYLCAQSLFKIHPDMDAVFSALLRQDKDARLALFRATDDRVTRALRERLRVSLGSDAARVDWLPQCSEQEFFLHLAGADAVIDTMHFSGGATSYKALGCGIPVVTHEGAFLRGRQTAGLYRHMGVEGPVARSSAELAELALRMAHAPAWRRELAQQLAATAPKLFAAQESVLGLATFLNGNLGEDNA